jgi:hypothetical protein
MTRKCLIYGEVCVIDTIIARKYCLLNNQPLG